MSSRSSGAQRFIFCKAFLQKCLQPEDVNPATQILFTGSSRCDAGEGFRLLAESTPLGGGHRFPRSNLTDFAVLACTGWFSWNLTSSLYGGYATRPSLFPIANVNSDQRFAVDLNIKF
jgi:hypothetical protein